MLGRYETYEVIHVEHKIETLERKNGRDGKLGSKVEQEHNFVCKGDESSERKRSKCFCQSPIPEVTFSRLRL